MNQTAHQLHDAIIREQSVCLRQLGKIRAGEVRYGRWLHNDKVQVSKLIDTICQDISERSAGRHLLLIQDTFELNYAAHKNRNLDPDSQRLFAWLHALPVQGQHHLALPARTGGRSARHITLDIRYGHTHIRRPIHNTDPNSQPRIGLWAIEAREKSDSQSGEPPICWRLLTTHPVTSLTDAQRCLQWYNQRWHIEQSFRILKKQGLDIESSLVEEAAHLEKLVVLAVSAAVHTLQLTLARDGQSDRPATDCFDAPQQQLLQQLNPTLEGKTVKQQNPHPSGSLAWAAWIIARLGGWKGYASERPPGPITMLRGLE
ncbi:MAG: IS4 family transposase, partial [Cardiobacteriaceae bacterium]|nr:IS4 family transposase [Cardiobacteriaceae bacterium]